MLDPKEIDKIKKELADTSKQAQLLIAKSLEIRSKIMENEIIALENKARRQQNLNPVFQ